MECNGFPLWLSWQRIHLQRERPGFDLWVGKNPWWRERLPTPVFWPREFNGLCSPWGHKELDKTEWLSLSLVMERHMEELERLKARSEARLQNGWKYSDFSGGWDPWFILLKVMQMVDQVLVDNRRHSFIWRLGLGYWQFQPWSRSYAQWKHRGLTMNEDLDRDNIRVTSVSPKSEKAYKYLYYVAFLHSAYDCGG